MTKPAASSDEAAAYYHNMFRNAASGLARVDMDGRMTDINDRFCEMLGYERDQLLA